MSQKKKPTNKQRQRVREIEINDLDCSVDARLSKPARRYWESIVDPRSGPKAKVPTSIGGFPGRTKSIRLKAEVDVVLGTQGFGYLVANPGYNIDASSAGPFSDRIIGAYTELAFTGTSSTNISSTTTATTGVTGLNWGNSTYLGAAPNNKSAFNYRCVSFAIYVKPINPRLSQGGKYYMYESAGHAGVNVAASLISGYTRARRITGVDQARENVLNWHPSSLSNDASGANEIPTDDFWFYTIFGSNTVGVPQGLYITFYGAAADSYSVEVVGIYEIRGSAVIGKTLSPVDTLGMEAVMNCFNAKTLSGWSGNSRDTKQGYAHRLLETNKHLMKEHEKTLWEKIKGSDLFSGLASKAAAAMGSLF